MLNLRREVKLNGFIIGTSYALKTTGRKRIVKFGNGVRDLTSTPSVL